MKKFYLSLSCCFIFLQLFAQTQSITIKVTNQKREPLAFASVSVINRNDSLKIITKVADSNGVAKFSLEKRSQYTVKITSVNYLLIEKGINISGEQSFFSFVAERMPKSLNEVVVTSKKPLIRQEDDKTIIDPENLVAASTSGYEVIEKTPGLFVDQDGNIYISSFTPATVQINGRDLKMSAADVATMLKSFPPNAIQQIEVVRTPSASQDASGSGGVVNVVLRKGFKPGLTGSVNSGMQQGNYGNQYAGFNINNNDGQKNLYVSLNYNRRNNYEKIMSDRVFAPDTVITQDAFTKYPANAYNGNYMYSFSKNKWDFELSGNTSFTQTKSRSENTSLIEKISTGYDLSNNLNQTNNNNKSFLIGNGFEVKLKIDTIGSEWNSQVFHYYTHNTGEQVFSTIFTLPVIPASGGDGESDNKRNLFSAKSDLKLKLKKKLTIETGVKSTLHRFRNATEYYRTVNNVRSKDNSRTNSFNYDENINAAYFQAAKTFGKDIVIKVGARLENINMKGHQIIPYDTTFNIHRTDLFPYVYLSKNLMKIMGYELRAYLVYRRSISRPGYDQLNPFPKFVDQYLTEMGNPALKPQFTRNWEANVSVDERPILAVGVNDTKDIFSLVTYQADSVRSQALRTYDNLGKNREWYFRGLGALPPGGRYFFVLGAQFNYQIYDGLYENKPLSFKKGTWTFFTYHTFKLDKRSVITVNGFMRLKGQQQLYELGSFGMLNASVNRKFAKEKFIVTLSMNDIFFTNKIDFALKQGSVNATGRRYNDTRRFGINLRYNFGVRKKEEKNILDVESPEKTN
ncbi:MAG: TonB-dependent receptor [Sphingobacteriales bacterium]|nr:TonB-dependent receptor [Sphingobacteriales bacterium]